MRRVGIAFLLAVFLGSCVTPELRAQVIVVPNALATNDGDAFSTTPTGPAQVRNMKIYDASQFGALSGPALLTRFAWRPDSIPNASGPRTVTLRIYASTTSRSVAGLSMTFADNVGTNSTLVFDGTLIWTTQNLPGPGNTRQFDMVFPFTTPFLYDPADGNLLLDFQQYGEGSAITYDRTSDTSLTRQIVNTVSSNAPTAEFDPGSQVVTQFTFEPPPLVTIRASQGELWEVCWNSISNLTYQVQYRSDLTTNLWTPLGDCIRSANPTSCVYDPIVVGQPQRFYRVVLTNCAE